MAGKKKNRECRLVNNEIFFKPSDTPMKELEILKLDLDEFEALRLCDYEGRNQIEAGIIMNISRGTIQRLLTSGRKKILESLLKEKALCIRNDASYFKELKKTSIEKLKVLVRDLEEFKIAFPINDDFKFESYFGKATNFLIVSFDQKKIMNKEVIKAPNYEPGEFPKFLSLLGVKVVVVDSVGERAINCFNDYKIEVLFGMGDSIEEVLELIKN